MIFVCRDKSVISKEKQCNVMRRGTIVKVKVTSVRPTVCGLVYGRWTIPQRDAGARRELWGAILSSEAWIMHFWWDREGCLVCWEARGLGLKREWERLKEWRRTCSGLHPNKDFLFIYLLHPDLLQSNMKCGHNNKHCVFGSIIKYNPHMGLMCGVRNLFYLHDLGW